MGQNFTTVVALDRHCADQLEGVWPTWRRFKPEIFRRPLLAVCDYMAGNDRWWKHRLRFLDHPDRKLALWDWPDSDDSELAGMSQRERMLTGWVKVPPVFVETDYWLKIDTDVVATHRGPWFFDEWFAGKPALIASPWGYTKPARWPGDLDRWAATVPTLAPGPALDLPEPAPDQGTIRHKRIASWLCFVNKIWSKTCVTHSPGRLPVPSQDTYHWYCAWRMGETVVRAKMKRYGWACINRDRNRRRLVAEVLAADAGQEEECC